MSSQQSAEVLQTATQPVALSTSHQPSPGPTFPSEAVFNSLATASPLLLVCLTSCTALYFGVQIMEQINRFVEMVRKK
jgi:hypothetical protein